MSLSSQISDSVKDPSTWISLSGPVCSIIVYAHLSSKINDMSRKIDNLTERINENYDSIQELSQDLNSKHDKNYEKIKKVSKTSKKAIQNQHESLVLVCEDLKSVNGAISDLGREVELKVGILAHRTNPTKKPSHSRSMADSSDEEDEPLDILQLRRQARKVKSGSRRKVGI